MSKNILKDLRKFGLDLDNSTKCPKKYMKFNNPDSHPFEPRVSPRGWFMFILDKFEKEKYGK
jgi:hypothetical protein